MAKGGGIGKLGKLKCMIKRWQSASGGHGRLPPSAGSSVSTTPAAAVDDDDASWPGVLEGNQLQHGRSNKIINGGGDVEYYREAVAAQSGLRPVFVGKSRRRYLISSHLVDHPLFRVLVQRSGRSGAAEDDDEGSTAAAVVGCEVVLFEHLLWMLDNADDPLQPESDLDELAEFYAC